MLSCGSLQSIFNRLTKFGRYTLISIDHQNVIAGGMALCQLSLFTKTRPLVRSGKPERRNCVRSLLFHRHCRSRAGQSHQPRPPIPDIPAINRLHCVQSVQQKSVFCQRINDSGQADKAPVNAADVAAHPDSGAELQRRDARSTVDNLRPSAAWKSLSPAMSVSVTVIRPSS